MEAIVKALSASALTRFILTTPAILGQRIPSMCNLIFILIVGGKGEPGHGARYIQG